MTREARRSNSLLNKLLLLFLALTAVAIAATALSAAINWSPWTGMASRWIALATLIAYASVRRSLTTWIFVSMLVGGELGHDFPALAAPGRLLSQIFLRLIKTIIAPLIFSTLVVGIASHTNLKQVGRMGIKALVYFEVVTTLALFIGLAAINLTQAGVGLPLSSGIKHEEVAALPQQSPQDLILHIFPENLAKAVVEGNVLQVVVFSIIFAIALGLLRENRRRPMLAFCESLSETMFKFTNIVMYLAPAAVGGAIAYTIGTMGLGVLRNLAALLLTLYLALIAFLLLVLLPIAVMARVPVRPFVRAVAEPASIAFATSTSEAALPRAMEAMEAIGVPRRIVAFVIPTGYSFNLDGSTLYLSLTAIFVAQAASVHFSLSQQLLMVFTLMLTSKGVAGVPRAALVILLGTVASFHLPVEPVFVILGIDGLMDMGRTSVNVAGNCLASAVIARWEGEFGKTAQSPEVLDAVAN